MRRPESALFRAAATPTLLAGAAVAVGGVLTAGGDGLIGAILGTLLVVAFFGIGLLVSHRTARVAPLAVMGVALLTYTAKVFALGLVLVVFRDTTLFDPTVFALAVLVTAVVWLVAQVRAFTRVPMLYVDPDLTRTTSQTTSQELSPGRESKAGPI